MKRIVLCVLLSILAAASGQVVITEISPNPTGSSSAIPGDLSHEFIEVYNAGSLPVNLCGYYIKTSSAGSVADADSNNLQVWAGDSLRDIGGDSLLRYDSLLLPGAYGVILGRKYVSAPESSWYKIRAGATVYATRKTYLKSGGLTNSAAVAMLFSEENAVVSTFNSFASKSMDPGEGYTWQRAYPDSSDAPLNWKLALPTPGGAYPNNTSRDYGRNMAISEFMCDPATGGAEWVELCNFGNDTVNLLGWKLRTGDEAGYITLTCLFIPPAGYLVLKQPEVTGDPLLSGVLCPVVAPQAWGGLSRNGDIISLSDASGTIVDSLCYSDNEFNVEKGVSLERISCAAPALSAGNWKLCSASGGATPGFSNSRAAEGGCFSFIAGNRRIIPGCGSLALINMTLSMPLDGEFSLKVYDLKGRQVRSLYDKAKGLSLRYATWDGLDAEGQHLPSGVYILYCAFNGPSAASAKKISVVLGGKCHE